MLCLHMPPHIGDCTRMYGDGAWGEVGCKHVMNSLLIVNAFLYLERRLLLLTLVVLKLGSGHCSDRCS